MYLSWNNKTITDFSDKNITSLYCEGYLFTREGRGKMYQTRSLRIDLNKFEPSSENKRVLRKNEAVELGISPLPYTNYHWSIGKLGKDFYETKFGLKTFSANKIKELLTDENKSNFNKLFIYTVILNEAERSEESLSGHGLGQRSFANAQDDSQGHVGYCIALETNDLIHYCYPFYQISNIQFPISNIGLGMMTKAVMRAKESGKNISTSAAPSAPPTLTNCSLKGWSGLMEKNGKAIWKN